MGATIVYPWQIRQGADFQFQATWSTGAPVLPVSLVGCTAICMIRQLPTDSGALLSITTVPNAQGAIVLGGASGTVLVNIYRAATLLLPAGAMGGATSVEGIWGKYRLDILFPANTPFPLGQNWAFAEGPVWVEATV
jgi:hypothetical protein